MMDSQLKYSNFIKSALTLESDIISITAAKQWLHEKNNQVKVEVSKVRFTDLEHWYFDRQDGALRHDSGKFFSIEGIEVETNWGSKHSWQQPIINQPEIGFLGIIAKKIGGTLHFLMQAKIEPGNVNNVQLSPTLQATKSNYTQVHKGRQPLYLEYFAQRNKYVVLLDQLQSEQGARFLKKRNRNIIIEVDEDIPVFEDFIWLTLGQVKLLTSESNLVNMDTRTVISGIPFGSFPAATSELLASVKLPGRNEFEQGMLMTTLNNENSLYTLDEVIAWLTHLKTKYDLRVKSVRLEDIDEWCRDDCAIYHKDNRFFRVIAVDVEIANREVRTWRQPLIEPSQEGIIAFIVKKINGIYHFLVQAKLECGNFDLLEMAPTVQCITGNYRDTRQGALPFLEYVLNAVPEHIRYDAYQSEEGGRFYREQNRNMIIEGDDDFPLEVPENYIWMTLCQLSYFLKFNNYLNIQARSLVSAIRFI